MFWLTDILLGIACLFLLFVGIAIYVSIPVFYDEDGGFGIVLGVVTGTVFIGCSIACLNALTLPEQKLTIILPLDSFRILFYN